MKRWNLPMATLLVPEHLHAALRRYLEQHIMTGSFLEAVLTNDLEGACLRGDAISLSRLASIVEYLHNCAPREAWGSPKKVGDWVARRDELIVS
jgi:hypothetical protein